MTKFITNSKASQGVKTTPENYEAAEDTLAAHLQGIDEALARGEVSGYFVPEIVYVSNVEDSVGTPLVNRGFYAKVGNVISGTVVLEMKIIDGTQQATFKLKKLAGAREHNDIVTCSRFRDFHTNPVIYDAFCMVQGTFDCEIQITTIAGQSNNKIFGTISFMYDLELE